jgi:uncharacterized protein (TIGR03437 family)
MTVRGPNGTITFPTVFVAAARPQIFAQPNPNGSGGRDAIALNVDGTLNSASNPAANGSVVTVFVSGAGLVDGQRTDGSIISTPFSYPTQSVSANSLYAPANVTYIGDATNSVLGVIQVKLQVSRQNVIYVQAGGAASDFVNLHVSGP